MNPGSMLLPHTLLEKGVLVGVHAGEVTVLVGDRRLPRYQDDHLSGVAHRQAPACTIMVCGYNMLSLDQPPHSERHFPPAPKGDHGQSGSIRTGNGIA